MKLSMALTMDGLVRALRWTSHDLAEATEHGYVATDRAQASERAPRQDLPPAKGEASDDRAVR